MLKSLLYSAFTCAVAFSCQKSPEKKHSSQEFRLNIHSEPPSLDPRKPSDTTSINVLRMCFDGLMRLDQKGEKTFALAEKINISEDGKTYTFFLRKSEWSDGHPLTAHDFALSWKAILDPAFPSEFSNDLYVIKNGKAAKERTAAMEDIGLKVLDDYTLEVELEHPYPYFLDLVVTHAFLPIPSHIVETNKNWAYDGGSTYVCNGPFQIAEWKHHNRIILEKNPHYWDASEVKLDKLSLYMIEDEMTELSMYENNELDWVGSPMSSLPSDAIIALSQNKEFDLYEMAGTYYYIFNTKSFPFTNANMRKAFTLAINRKDIVENVTQAKQVPAMALIPTSLWDHNTEYFKDADTKEARRLFQIALKELGIQAKDLPEIKLSYNTTSGHHKIAQAIKEQWSNAFGVRVQLENMEWKVFLDEVATHKFQIARMGGIAGYNDPITFLETYKYGHSRINHSQWSNAKFTALLDEADTISDPKDRMKILAQAEMILMEEMPIAPIYFYTGSYLKKPYVKSVHLSHLSDVDFKYAYREIR